MAQMGPLLNLSRIEWNERWGYRLFAYVVSLAFVIGVVVRAAYAEGRDPERLFLVAVPSLLAFGAAIGVAVFLIRVSIRRRLPDSWIVRDFRRSPPR